MSITKLNNLSVSALTALPSGLGGKVLQVVQTVKTDSFSLVSGTFTDVTGLSVSITPSSASNKILVTAMISGTGSNDASAKLLRGSTDIALGDASSARTRMTTALERGGFEATGIIINFLDSPNTTSATTYKIQVNGYSSVFINRENTDADEASSARAISTITAMEIAP
jgi:hypothetical protein